MLNQKTDLTCKPRNFPTSPCTFEKASEREVKVRGTLGEKDRGGSAGASLGLSYLMKLASV